MSKRNLWVLLFFTAVLLTAIYLVTRRVPISASGDPYKAIPYDACFIVESPDVPGLLNNLSGKSGLFRELLSLKELSNFKKVYSFLDTILIKKEVKQLFEQGNAVISFHVQAKGKLVPLLSVNIKSDLRRRHIREIIEVTGATDIKESQYEGFDVFEVAVNQGAERSAVFVALGKGSLLCTTSQVLLENSIRQMAEENDIRKEESFTRVFEAAGRNEDRLFVLFRNLPPLIKSLTSGKGDRLSDQVGMLAGTGEGDLLIREDGVIVSGYLESVATAEALHKYRNQSAISFDSYKILPSNTAFFKTSAFSAVKNAAQVSATATEPINLIASQIFPFTGDEVTHALLDIKGRPAKENMILAYEIRNSDHIEKAIAAVLNVSSGNDENIIWFSPDDQTRIPVYKAPSAGLHSQLVPGFASGLDDIYYVFYDNFLITGSSYVTISSLLYDNILRRTLSNDIVYRDFESTLPSRTVFYFYCVPSKLTEFLSDYLNTDLSGILKSNLTLLKKIPTIGFSFAPSNEMLYHSMSVSFVEEVREESTSEWETLLDTTACIKPFFFTNHTTGAREIFVQDLSNNVYLINSAGRVLWKAPIRERITGPVYMVDYVKNGKFQLLFAGKDYLHMLDRNGNYVERYPVKLRSPAAGPLSVFDYDNNRDYRLFVPGEDRKIYAYDKSGNVVKGWVPYKTNSLVQSEMKFFRVSGKDYIIAGDESGLYFLDRKGSVRFTVREPVRKAVKSEMRLLSGPEPAVVCSSPDGEVQIISFNGAVKKISLQKFSADHSFEYFDVDGDGTGEFIFIDKGKLYLYSENGTKVFSRDFNTGDLGGPIGFVFSDNDRGIGVVDNKQSLIYIVDKKGEPFGGFPLRGASMFSIGKMTGTPGFNLIVGGTDSFLYNYKILR